MFIIKYTFSNILRNLKLYFFMFVILIIILLNLMYTFSIRKNTQLTNETLLHEQTYAVGITAKNGYYADIYNLPDKYIPINDLAESFAIYDYVTDYYIYDEALASSKDILGVDVDNIPLKFKLVLYDDISKSIDFTANNRKIIDGRYALYANECIISTEIAELNNLKLGDKIVIWHQIEMVLVVTGIFTDATPKFGNEFDYFSNYHDEKNGYKTSLGTLFFRCNEILTVLATMDNVELLPTRVAVYIINKRENINVFQEDIKDSLPDAFVMLDNLEVERFIRQVINRTERGFYWLLTIVSSICLIFITYLFFRILRFRTSEIVILFTKEVSRIQTVLLFGCEIFVTSIISTTAFIAASILYYITFIPLTEIIYYFQRKYMSDFMWYHPDEINLNLANPVLAYKFNVSISLNEFIYSFIIAVLLSIIIGITNIFFIKRMHR